MAKGSERSPTYLACVNEGLVLRYDYTAVNRWVKRGEKTRSPVPTLLAQTLSERLGRRVSPVDIGMTEEATRAARGLRYADDPGTAVDTIIDLGRADVRRRDQEPPVRRALYEAAAEHARLVGWPPR